MSDFTGTSFLQKYYTSEDGVLETVDGFDQEGLETIDGFQQEGLETIDGFQQEELETIDGFQQEGASLQEAEEVEAEPANSEEEIREIFEYMAFIGPLPRALRKQKDRAEGVFLTLFSVFLLHKEGFSFVLQFSSLKILDVIEAWKPGGGRLIGQWKKSDKQRNYILNRLLILCFSIGFPLDVKLPAQQTNQPKVFSFFNGEVQKEEAVRYGKLIFKKFLRKLPEEEKTKLLQGKKEKVKPFDQETVKRCLTEAEGQIPFKSWLTKISK